MKPYLIVVAVIAALLYSAGLVWVGYKLPHPPCPIAEPDTAREDSLQNAASLWEGKANAYREERDALSKLRQNYLRTRPSTSSTINRNTHAIRTAGFTAAVDTLNKRPE